MPLRSTALICIVPLYYITLNYIALYNIEKQMSLLYTSFEIQYYTRQINVMYQLLSPIPIV